MQRVVCGKRRSGWKGLIRAWSKLLQALFLSALFSPILPKRWGMLKKGGGIKLALDNYEAAQPLTSEGIDGKSSILLALGPERGWSAGERMLLRSKGFELRHLGDRVLRLETAVVASLGVLLSGYWKSSGCESL